MASGQLPVVPAHLTMPTLIISDLHLGSNFCQYDKLRAWLEDLPDGVDLVLNGDVVHAKHSDFVEEHLALLGDLRRMAETRRIVWVEGNHEKHHNSLDRGCIEYVPWHRIGPDLVVAHGHHFEARGFLALISFSVFRQIYKLHRRLGGPPMHVARYARQFPVLFSVFRNAITRNAVRFARRHDARTVVCGHTHFSEERALDGVRYFNTGSWTELPSSCLFVDDKTIELREITT